MRRRTRLTTILAAVLLGAAPSLALDSPVGTWRTVDEKSGTVVSEVELYDQGGKLYGRITKLTEPIDAQGKPKLCTKCQGADKDQPVVGLVMVRGYLGLFYRTQTWQKAR